MATTAVRRTAVKQQDADAASQVVVDHLEELARQGARQMLVTALQEEVEAYLGRDRYQRTGALRGYDRAAEYLEKDLDRCLTFYPFPEAHWCHLRTSNPIESIFGAVRLRTNAARRFKKTKSGVWLVHQVIERLSKRWRRLCSAHLCSTVPLPGQQQVPVAIPA